MLPLLPLVLIYLAFVAKHLLADYFLQTKAMVEGKEREHGWLRPLLAHSAVHAAGTALIVLVAAPSLWWLAPIDLLIHSSVDRTKAVVSRRLGLGPADGGFWWALGTDQSVHQLTHFAYVLLLVEAWQGSVTGV